MASHLLSGMGFSALLCLAKKSSQIPLLIFQGPDNHRNVIFKKVDVDVSCLVHLSVVVPSDALTTHSVSLLDVVVSS